MADQPIPLSPLNFPLHGTRLIEASAGTGKTYTLAALYVRLVLGEGQSASEFDTCPARPLLPPEILVVTFTKAATLELRSRIRTRLTEVAQLFRTLSQSDDASSFRVQDGFLRDLTARYPDPADCTQAALKLERAADWMDEAAIFTLHGWAQRMLVQHPFDTGSDLTRTLDTQTSDLLREAGRDYWRIYIAPLPESALGHLISGLKSPEHLTKWVKKLVQEWIPVAVDGVLVDERKSPNEFLEHYSAWSDRYEQALEQVKQIWREQIQENEGQLREAYARGDLNKNSTKLLETHLSAMRVWVMEGQSPEDPEKTLAYLFMSGAKVRKNCPEPEYPAKLALARILECLALRPSTAPVLVHALFWIRTRFFQAKEAAALFDYDDLLVQVSEALKRDTGALHARIRTQYPVALIDEFQDTDPLQYAIFQRLYRDQPDLGLILIGDPKQSIYSFRGADIDTYIEARKDAQGSVYTLPTNYRSTEALVRAVNRLFGQAEKRTQQGAFRCDGAIPFQCVSARGTDRSLMVNDSCEEGLHLLHLPSSDESLSADQRRHAQARVCVQTMVNLLQLADQGRATIGSEPIHSGDMAVLVRTTTEAQLMQSYLQRAEIPSVFLSDKESVFMSQEALDLWRWISAMHEPLSRSKLITALATPTLGRDPDWLASLSQDERLWEQQVERFLGFQSLWRQSGVLASIRALIAEYQLAQSLLEQPAGERQLTNLLHLAELLQHAAIKIDGERGLIRYLAEQIQSPREAQDDQLVRMESDAARVKVVTLHASKGLEYPLVFIPFGQSIAPKGRYADGIVSSQNSERQLNLGAQSQQLKARAQETEIQEETRILYVGLTRAIYACWVGITQDPKAEISALGQLIDLPSKCDDSLWLDRIEPLIGSDSTIYHQFVDLEPLQRAPRSRVKLKLGSARSLQKHVSGQFWNLSSYSALAARTEKVQMPREGGELIEEQQTELIGESVKGQAADQLLRFLTIHQFTRGAAAGTYLHSVLERAADQGFDQTALSQELMHRALALQTESVQWQASEPMLVQWLGQALRTPFPLPEGSFRLGELNRYRAELEFMFSAKQLEGVALDQCCAAAVLKGQPRPKLNAAGVNGMLKGFIDLVFEHQSRFWVLDYKSNWLGPGADSYGREEMQQSLLDKRYDLQLMLYLLALHRLLVARDPDYAADPRAGYEQRVGGALYLYFRGIENLETRGILTVKPDFTYIERLDQLMKGSA